MKKIMIAVLIVLSFGCKAQNVKKTASGNYVEIANTNTTKTTGKTLTTKSGEVFQVSITSKGKEFVIRTSKKTGKEYKQYLKIAE